ncbi:MAG: LPS assembly lipoprotein LptE [Opitutaceae bacterium]
MNARRLFLIGTSLISLALFSGCASYKLGAPTELQFESIYIRPASNDSFAPQVQTLVSAQIREAFIRDGRVKLLSKESDADAVLSVNITNYERNAGARHRRDTVSARTFRLTMFAEISLYNAKQGDFFFEERNVSEYTSVYADNPFVDAKDFEQRQAYNQAEYSAMTRIARGIARKISDEVLSPWPSREQEAKKAEVIEETATPTAE